MRPSGRQQAQPDPCEPDERGSLALRSLTAMAVRFVVSIPAMKGARKIARSDIRPQTGQSQGSLHADIGFNSLNGPHLVQT